MTGIGLWQLGGRVNLHSGKTELTLRDLTGFCGRCDAIFLSQDDTPPPKELNKETRAWRWRFCGLSDKPDNLGTFNVLVVGGGVTGAAAALTAARLGECVALVQDRPVLSGNVSVEIGLSPHRVTRPLINKLSQQTTSGNLMPSIWFMLNRTQQSFWSVLYITQLMKTPLSSQLVSMMLEAAERSISQHQYSSTSQGSVS